MLVITPGNPDAFTPACREYFCVFWSVFGRNRDEKV